MANSKQNKNTRFQDKIRIDPKQMEWIRQNYDTRTYAGFLDKIINKYKESMKWTNLKNNKCPDCGKSFTMFGEDTINCKCGFKISIKRFQEIVGDMHNNKRITILREVEDNQQALSEL